MMILQQPRIEKQSVLYTHMPWKRVGGIEESSIITVDGHGRSNSLRQAVGAILPCFFDGEQFVIKGMRPSQCNF